MVRAGLAADESEPQGIRFRVTHGAFDQMVDGPLLLGTPAELPFGHTARRCCVLHDGASPHFRSIWTHELLRALPQCPGNGNHGIRSATANHAPECNAVSKPFNDDIRNPNCWATSRERTPPWIARFGNGYCHPAEWESGRTIDLAVPSLAYPVRTNPSQLEGRPTGP